MRSNALISLFALQLFFASSLGAQALGFESLLSTITDVSVFFTCWQTRGAVVSRETCPSRQNGFGLEVSYNVGKLAWWRSPVKRYPETRERVSVQIKCGGAGCDTTESFNVVKAREEPLRYLFFELGMGYSQFAGFRSGDSTLDLRGTVRELPSVSLYATYRDETKRLSRSLNPYIGLSTGYLVANNLVLYDRVRGDTSTVYSATAGAFQAGIVAGIQLSVRERLRVYYEYNNTYRRLPSLQWASTGTNRVRDAFPRELNFSGSGSTLGVQVSLRTFRP